MKKILWIVILIIFLVGCKQEVPIARLPSDQSNIEETQIKSFERICDGNLYYYFDDLIVGNDKYQNYGYYRYSQPKIVLVFDNNACLEDLNKNKIDCIHGFANSLNLRPNEIKAIEIKDMEHFYDVQIDCINNCRIEYQTRIKEGLQEWNHEKTEIINTTKICWS